LPLLVALADQLHDISEMLSDTGEAAMSRPSLLKPGAETAR